MRGLYLAAVRRATKHHLSLAQMQQVGQIGVAAWKLLDDRWTRGGGEGASQEAIEFGQV